jgi:hypothetical protein
MSSETRQYVEELVALSPWVAFIILVAWFWVLDVRDNARTSRADERVRPGRSDSGSAQAERKYPAVGELHRFYASTSPRLIA